MDVIPANSGINCIPVFMSTNDGSMNGPVEQSDDMAVQNMKLLHFSYRVSTDNSRKYQDAEKMREAVYTVHLHILCCNIHM